MEKRFRCALLANLDKIHTTRLGEERIRKNLGLRVGAVEWCKATIQNDSGVIYRKGKNWYAVAVGCKITVNAHSYTIITAHKTV